MPIGHSFIELQSVDSTNNYAMALASQGEARHGTLVFAHHQWAGKGQRGRSWTSAPGENIILSAVLEPVAFPAAAAFSFCTSSWANSAACAGIIVNTDPAVAPTARDRKTSRRETPPLAIRYFPFRLRSTDIRRLAKTAP